MRIFGFFLITILYLRTNWYLLLSSTEPKKTAYRFHFHYRKNGAHTHPQGYRCQRQNRCEPEARFPSPQSIETKLSLWCNFSPNPFIRSMCVCVGRDCVCIYQTRVGNHQLMAGPSDRLTPRRRFSPSTPSPPLLFFGARREKSISAAI